MYPPGDIGTEGLVNGAVPLDAAHRCKGRGPDANAEMALPASVVSGMARVAVTLVQNRKFLRHEGLHQASLDFR